MREGWAAGDNYLILFDDAERGPAAQRYNLASILPGFALVGLLGWDDFLVRDTDQQLFSVPTVPCIKKQLAPFPEAALQQSLEADSRFTGRIKWYVKPLVFGGDPQAGDNMTWISHAQHAELVRWWNEQYRALAGN